jgi:hypothetical protein
VALPSGVGPIAPGKAARCSLRQEWKLFESGVIRREGIQAILRSFRDRGHRAPNGQLPVASLPVPLMFLLFSSGSATLD